jgi:hypothetical protein
MNAIVMPRKTSTDSTREEGAVTVLDAGAGVARVAETSVMVIHDRSQATQLCSFFF